MFSIKFALTNMKRSFMKWLIVSFVIAILSALIFLYDYILETYENKLEDIYSNMDLTASVSFTPYTSDEDRNISRDFVEEIKRTGFVKDTSYKIVYDYKTYYDNYLRNNIKLEEMDKKLIGINKPDIFNSVVDTASIDFLEGYDAEKIFGSSEPVCILSVNVSRRLALDLGDSIKLTVMTDLYDEENFTIVPFTIVGTYSTKATDYTIYTPFEYLADQITSNGQAYRIDEVVFSLTNLKEIKGLESKFIDMGLINNNSYLPGMSCSIDSTEFVRMTNEVKKIISIMTSLRLTVHAIIFFVDFAIAYMYAESKRKTLFIMRSMGTQKLNSFISVFFENTLICLLGIIVGLLIFSMFSSIHMNNIIAVIIFFTVFLTGTIASICSMLSKNILSILSVKE